MLTERQRRMILAVNDLSAVTAEGSSLYDGISIPSVPDAPEEHYDKLARAIVAYVAMEDDPARAVRFLNGTLRSIEKMAQLRTSYVNGSPAHRQMMQEMAEAQLARSYISV